MKIDTHHPLPTIDNERASAAERARYLALHGYKISPPQHGGLVHYLQRGIAVKALQAGDMDSALKEACALI